MKNVLIIAAVITFLGISVWTARKSGIEQPATIPAVENASEVGSSEAIENIDAVGLATTEPSFELNLDRLFDKSYLDDAGLKALAREKGTTAGCIVAQIKLQMHQIPIEQGDCPRTEKPNSAHVRATAWPGPGEPHPYDDLPGETLIAMSEWDPAAAVVYARKVENDQQSLRYYERALVLTGNPQPLIEWLNFRTSGEQLSPTENIDTDQALVAYQIYLVTSEFGIGEGVASNYEERLLAAGVEISGVQAKARQIADRVREEQKKHFPANQGG